MTQLWAGAGFVLVVACIWALVLGLVHAQTTPEAQQRRRRKQRLAHLTCWFEPEPPDANGRLVHVRAGATGELAHHPVRILGTEILVDGAVVGTLRPGQPLRVTKSTMLYAMCMVVYADKPDEPYGMEALWYCDVPRAL